MDPRSIVRNHLHISGLPCTEEAVDTRLRDFAYNLTTGGFPPEVGRAPIRAAALPTVPIHLRPPQPSRVFPSMLPLR